MNNLHKTAKLLRELAPYHPGILESSVFDDIFDLRCYAPPDTLREIVAYIWIQHPRSQPPHAIPLEIPSSPSAYLFLSASSAYVHGVGFSSFQYNPASESTYAGVKFLPGGLNAYWKKPMHELYQNNIEATSIFPNLDTSWLETIDTMNDASIVQQIETTLLKTPWSLSPKTRLVNSVLRSIALSERDETPTQIARKFRMSTRGLELLFRDYVGVSLKKVMSRQRLLAAIAESNTAHRRTWTDISAEFSYSSQSHFSREFKAVTGTSPSRYRQAR